MLPQPIGIPIQICHSNFGVIIVYLCSVHEGHGYNEAVEDYNRAQHSSSSSPSRGYTDHLNAASPGPVNTAGAPVPNTTAATYSTAQHISTMMGTPGSPGIFQSSSSKFPSLHEIILV